MVIKRDKLAATDFSDIATGRRLAPVHPGEILAKEFIEAKGISRYRVAKAMGVQQRMVDEICASTRAISAATALRLERVFGMEAQVWLNLQARYDLEIAGRDMKKKIDREARPLEEVM
jgi:addiction module HigA family antidote